MREYQCLLHRAISDKLELEQHMVTCGMEAGGGAGEGQGGEDKHIKGWGADPSDNDRQCNFSRRLPWPLQAQSRSHAGYSLGAHGNLTKRCDGLGCMP